MDIGVSLVAKQPGPGSAKI